MDGRLPAPGSREIIITSHDGTDVRTYMLDYVMESGGTILAQYNYDKVSFADLVEMED